MPDPFNIAYKSDWTESELRALWDDFLRKEPSAACRWVELHKILKARFGQESDKYDEEYRSRSSSIQNYISTYVYPDNFDHNQVEKQVERGRKLSNTFDDMKLFYLKYLDNEEFWEKVS